MRRKGRNRTRRAPAISRIASGDRRPRATDTGGGERESNQLPEHLGSRKERRRPASQPFPPEPGGAPREGAAAWAWTDPEAATETRRALAECVVSRALAVSLSPPARESLAWLSCSEAQRALLGAAALLDGGRPGPVQEAALALVSLLPPSLEGMERAHRRIFGLTPRGRVCPYGTEYGREEIFQQAHQMADIAGFYLAFGLRPSPEEHERPDHVACELEFLGFLCMKEVHAADEGDREMFEVTRLARKRFLREHVGAFGRAFASSLVKEDPEGFFGAAGRLCEAFLEAFCAATGVPVGPAFLTLRPEMPEDIPMACGSGSDLIGIGSPRPR